MFFPSVHNTYLISQENCSRFVVEWRSDWVTGSIYLFQRFKKGSGVAIFCKVLDCFSFFVLPVILHLPKRRLNFSLTFLKCCSFGTETCAEHFISCSCSFVEKRLNGFIVFVKPVSIATWWRFQIFQHNFMGWSTYGLPLFIDRV